MIGLENWKNIIDEDLSDAWNIAGIALINDNKIALRVMTISGAQKVFKFTFSSVDDENFVFSEIN